MEDEITVRFRVTNVYKDCFIDVFADEERIIHRKRQIVSPGEMDNVIIKKSMLRDVKSLKILIES